MATPASMLVSFSDLQAKLAGLYFGRYGITVPLVTNTPLSAAQIAQINDCIKDGLNSVYSAPHNWSFMRPAVPITTNAPYSDATITLASGVVTLVSGTWPAWMALTSTLVIGGVSYSITDLDPLTIADPPDDIETAVSCSLVPTNIYPLPAGYDSVEGPFTYPTGDGWQKMEVEVIRGVEIRKMLSRDSVPAPPRYAAVTTAAFDPATSPGSLRQLEFYPIPDDSYTLSATMTLRPTMIDATNKYPLGAEVLSPVITEAVLAAAERNLEGQIGIHSQMFDRLLAEAIMRDKEYTAPSTLGPSLCPDPDEFGSGRFGRQSGAIYLNGDLLP